MPGIRIVLKFLPLMAVPVLLFFFMRTRVEQARLRPLNAAYIMAVQMGDIAGTGKMLVEGADVNARDPREHNYHGSVTRDPAILIATKSNDLELVQFLLKNGADPNATDIDKRTALHSACGFGTIAITRALLAHGADVNARDNTGRTPLIEAAHRGQAAAVELLLKHGAEVNVKGNQRFTSLSEVARCGRTAACPVIAQLLLDHGADVNIKDSRGFTPIDHAVLASRGKYGSSGVLQVLQGRRWSITTPKSTALIEATQCGGISQMRSLLARGANPNVLDDNSQSAFAVAANYEWGVRFGPRDETSGAARLGTIHQRRTRMIKLLLAPGTPLRIEGGRHARAVLQSAALADTSTLATLLGAGADPNARDAAGFTALMAAATTRDPNILKLLLAYGANKSATDKSGKKVWQWMPYTRVPPDEVDRLLDRPAWKQPQ